jgi:hypothetical protein
MFLGVTQLNRESSPGIKHFHTKDVLHFPAYPIIPNSAYQGFGVLLTVN